MRKLLLLVLVCSLPVYVYAQENPQEIFNKMLSGFKSHQSLSYNAELRTKYYDRPDTSYSDGTVHMMRDERDTVWGGMFWLGEGKKYDSYSFYDLNRRYVVQNTIHRAVIERARKGDIGLSMVYAPLLDVPFLRTQGTPPFSFKASSLLPETIINGKPCYVIQFKIVTANNGTNAATGATETWYISKADHFPLMVTKNQPNGQASVLVINSYQFDKVGPKQFSPDQIPSSYRIDNRDREQPRTTQPPIRPRNEWPLPGRR